MHKISVFIVLCLCMVSQYNMSAQNITLIDQNSQTPIVNASFQYGKQQGITGNDGGIQIQYDNQSSLEISHLNYGHLTFDAQQVDNLLKEGVFRWTRKNFELQPVSVLALHQSNGDSLSIQITSQKRLWHDASAVLTSLPEIALIRKSGNYGFDPVLRGFKYEQLNIVLDGAQSANAACPNRMDPPSSQMPVNMLSKISVLKGPYSLRYGNAFGGTINFQTTDPNYTANRTIDGRLSGSYESNGAIYRSEAMVGLSGKSTDIKLYGSISTGDNYEDGDGNEVPSSFYRHNLGSSLGFKLNDRQELEVKVAHNYAKDVDFPALPMDLRSDDTWLGSVHHTIKFNSKLNEWNTSIYGTYVDHLMDNADKLLSPRTVDAVTAAQTYNYGVRSEGFWLFNNSHLYAGVDYRFDKAEGERSRSFLMGSNAAKTVYDNVWQDAYIHKVGSFAEFQHSAKQWIFVYSARLEYNKADADKPDTYFSSLYSNLNSNTLNTAFSIGINRQLSSRIRAELWLGHAERSGSLTERYINFLQVGLDPYEMLGNPELSSEKNNQADLSFIYKNQSSEIQVSGFIAFLNDYISSEIRDDISPRMPSSPGVRQFINIDQAQLKGFEANWLQRLPFNLQHRLSVAYTYGENKDTNEALPEIPPLDIRYQLAGHYLNGKLSPSLSYRHVLKQDRIAESYGETVTPTFSLVDVSVNYRFNKHLELNITANNLLDETYYEHLSRSVKGSAKAINAPGRNLMFTLVTKL